MIIKYLKLLIALYLTCFIVSCNTKETENEVYLIAHAGGEINGDFGTNSLEALQKSIKDGYHYIELDLCLTSDSVLVAAHDWRTFNERTGYFIKKDTVPSLKEYKKRRIYGKYTPITAKEITNILALYPNIHLVTDKISNYKIINKNFSEFKKQIVIECFSYEDYQQLKNLGYYKVMYSDETRIDEYTKMIQLLKHAVFPKLFSDTQINELVVGRSFFNRKKNRFILNHSDTKVSIYTINDTKDIPAKYISRIDMIYTDSIKPMNLGKIRISLPNGN